MKVTPRQKGRGGIVRADQDDDDAGAHAHRIDWTDGSRATEVNILTTSFPVTEEEKAAARVIEDWLKRYEQFNVDAIPGLLGSANVDDHVKRDLFGAYQNSIGILASLQVAMDLIANGMSVQALVDPVLGRAMRMAARRADDPVDEAFEADIGGDE